LLIRRLGEQTAGAAAGAVEVDLASAPGVHLLEEALAVQAVTVRAPAGLEQVRVVLADGEARAADCGHPRARRRPVDRRGARRTAERLIAAVTRGEVDADPLERSLDERVAVRLDVAGRKELGRKPIRVGDDVGRVT